MSSQKNKLFIIIDSHALIHRAYHAIPSLTTRQGELVNAVYGFTAMLLRVLKEFKPHYFVATFDEHAPTFRKEMFEEYKATRRKTPDDLHPQVPLVKQVLSAFRIPVFSKAGFEADDIIGTIAKQVEDQTKDVDVIIVSGDLDTLQLVSSRTKVYTMRKRLDDTILYDVDAVKEKYGFLPPYLVDYKGLFGDQSDNIPGVVGVGEKTAQKLIQKYLKLENIYEAIEKQQDIGTTERYVKLLQDQKDEAFFSKTLATIRTDVPIDLSMEDAVWGGFDDYEVRQVFEELNFRRLLNIFNGLSQSRSQPELLVPKSRFDVMLDELEQTHNTGTLSDELFEIERAIIDIVIKMEKAGIQIDKNALQDLQHKVEKKLHSVEKKIYKIAGKEFNINSPAQLSAVLFEDLEISTKGIRKTAGKKISTAAPQLEKIIDAHPIIPIILQQRELQKILSTYINTLPTYADEQGRIHTTFHPLGTSTGRMSSSDPNLQNIPIRGEWASDLRKVFIADKGKQFLACDYSQMELRLVAHIAKDKNMIQAFQSNEDIHIRTAALVFGVEAEKVTDQMRYRAKALNFGIIYGIGARAFARNADISVDEARMFIDRYLSVFDGVARYMEQAKQRAQTNGYAETLYGRKRLLPDIYSPNPQFRTFAERVAINMPIQGTAADIVKIAMVQCDKQFPTLNLLLQIHDELLWEGENAEIKAHAERVASVLERVVDLSVPLTVKYSIGGSWNALK